MSNPLHPFTEFFEMADASRPDSIADLPVHDAAASRLRASLAELGLDASSPTVLAAVAAGAVEMMGATREHGSPVRGALAMGWALYDLAKPHLPALASTVAA